MLGPPPLPLPPLLAPAAAAAALAAAGVTPFGRPSGPPGLSAVQTLACFSNGSCLKERVQIRQTIKLTRSQ